MSRVYNFSAGPAVLPEEVLREAAEEMLDYKGTCLLYTSGRHDFKGGGCQRTGQYQEIDESAKKGQGFL